MISIENAQKAAELAERRRKVAYVNWRVTGLVGAYSAQEVTFTPDEALAWALEEYRARQLAAIDDELRELGVEPPAKSEPPEPMPEERARRLDYAADAARFVQALAGKKPKSWEPPEPAEGREAVPGQ